LVIQAIWVFIGHDATTRTNMTSLDGDRYQTTDGTIYRKIGSREIQNSNNRVPVVEEETGGGGGDSDDDMELSQYSQHSIDDLDKTFEDFGGRSKYVKDTYKNNRHSISEPINTQPGLSETVKTFDTAKNASANTHLLVKGPGDGKYSFVSIGTALAAKLYFRRHNFEELVENVQATWGKGAHVHAEMHLIHKKSNGDSKLIDGCLKDYILVVDKEVCADCYPFVVRAEPSEVRDSTNFFDKGAEQRKSWEDWKSPFSL
jgi:hypothetical protein